LHDASGEEAITLLGEDYRQDLMQFLEREMEGELWLSAMVSHCGTAQQQSQHSPLGSVQQQQLEQPEVSLLKTIREVVGTL
jgi:hypothetical protein